LGASTSCRADSLNDRIPPGRALRCKEKYRDYRAKVKRSIADNRLDALETPARALSSPTPHRREGNESDEEQGRAESDLEHGLVYWESLQNSVRLKRSAIRPQTVNVADVYVSSIPPHKSPHSSTHSPLSTTAHVSGGTFSYLKSGRPQPQFHIVEYAIEIDVVPDSLTSFSVPKHPAIQPVPDKLRPQRHHPVSHGFPRLRRYHGRCRVLI
jgi:hypothetical protein